MGLLVGIVWIVVGVLYIIYKFGEEELDLGKSGGIGCIFAVVTVFLIVYCFAVFCTEVTRNDAEATLLVWSIIAVLLIGGFLCYLSSSAQKEERRRETQEEETAILAINETLPLPTCSQMAQFINEIRTIEKPSEQQQIYRRFLQEADADKRTYPLDAARFKDMQAAWIFCSKNDSKSSRRKYEFGDQDLSEKAYFDPSIDRSREPTTGWDEKSFYMLVKQIPLNLKENWCCQPRFARKVFGMMEESETISAESLYPIMLECYQHPASCETETDAALAKVRMRDDLTSVWLSLIPKVIHVLSQVPLSRDEEQEWLKIEDFQAICLPAVSEQRFVKPEELFPEMLKIYNALLSTEFSRQPQKYSFVALWHGLDSVGKAIGKEGSFFDYPKYIVESEELA